MTRKFNGHWKKTTRKADSKWEEKLMLGCLKHTEHHPDTVPYVIAHKYHPDFKTKVGDKTVLIESKGFFAESSEASKYKHIRDYLPEDHELVFLFMRSTTPMPRSRVKKDGTKTTMADWADKNDFRWYSEDTIHELWENTYE